MSASSEVFILAGGLSLRWGNYLGVEKQFAPIDGIPIIENTIHLLEAYNASITLIVREDQVEQYRNYKLTIVPIPIEWSSKEYYKIKATKDYWNPSHRTILVMGDVWFTKKAIRKILECESKELLFFGRQRRSFHTHSKHGEIFAISFWGNHLEEISKACDQLERCIDERGILIAGGWGLYDIVSSIPFLMYPKVIRGFVLNSNFVNIIDLTDDVDSPADYDNMVAAQHQSRFTHSVNSFVSVVYYSLWAVFNVFFEIYVWVRFRGAFSDEGGKSGTPSV